MARACWHTRATAISPGCARKSPPRAERRRRRYAPWSRGSSRNHRARPRRGHSAAAASWPQPRIRSQSRAEETSMSALIFICRDPAVPGAVRGAGATAAAVGARRLPQSDVSGDRTTHQSADPAAAAHAAAGRQGRHRLGASRSSLVALVKVGAQSCSPSMRFPPPVLLGATRWRSRSCARCCGLISTRSSLCTAEPDRARRLFAAAIGARDAVRAGAASVPALIPPSPASICRRCGRASRSRRCSFCCASADS